MSSSDPPHYAASLSFLLSQVGARSAQLFAELLVPLGLSPRGFAVLSHIDDGSTRRLNQQQLADALGIHRNNMVSLIDELEAARLVKRRRSPVDRRAFDIHLTASGAASVARVRGMIPGLDEQVGQALSESERNLMAALLIKMAQALDLSPGVHPSLAATSR